MELSQFFKSLIDEDRSAIVMCDIHHKIIYMNPAACKRFDKRGGSSLLGRSLLDCHNDETHRKIDEVIEWFQSSQDHNRIYISYNEKENKDIYMIALRDENGTVIGYYERHEYRDRETEPFYNFD